MLSRREFLKLCMSSALTLSLTHQLHPLIEKTFAQRGMAKVPVIWLELGSCTGESISIDNAVNPDFHQILQEMMDLRFNWLLSATQGEQAVQSLFHTLETEKGNFWLIVEGAVMTAEDGGVNHIFLHNGELVTGLSALRMIAPLAKYIIAVGDCACFGGPAAAHPNPGGAKGVWDVVSQKVINIPGCPSHPDWMTGTFTHLLLYGLPQLDHYNRPTMFFGRTIHELCERRQMFEDGVFAKFPGEAGCLYKIGCKGPVTHADCPLRHWNHYVNWPVKAGTPCIGCANPHFPDGMMPFYNHLPNIQLGNHPVNVKKAGIALAAVGVGGVLTHLAGGVFAKRIHNHLIDGTKIDNPSPPGTSEQLKQELDDLIRQQKQLIIDAKHMKKLQRKQKKKTLFQRIADFWQTEPDPKE